MENHQKIAEIEVMIKNGEIAGAVRRVAMEMEPASRDAAYHRALESRLRTIAAILEKDAPVKPLVDPDDLEAARRLAAGLRDDASPRHDYPVCLEDIWSRAAALCAVLDRVPAPDPTFPIPTRFARRLAADLRGDLETIEAGRPPAGESLANVRARARRLAAELCDVLGLDEVEKATASMRAPAESDAPKGDGTGKRRGPHAAARAFRDLCDELARLPENIDSSPSRVEHVLESAPGKIEALLPFLPAAEREDELRAEIERLRNVLRAARAAMGREGEA